MGTGVTEHITELNVHSNCDKNPKLMSIPSKKVKVINSGRGQNNNKTGQGQGQGQGQNHKLIFSPFFPVVLLLY